jgi:hypothetical protein
VLIKGRGFEGIVTFLFRAKLYYWTMYLHIVAYKMGASLQVWSIMGIMDHYLTL